MPFRTTRRIVVATIAVKMLAFEAREKRLNLLTQSWRLICFLDLLAFPVRGGLVNSTCRDFAYQKFCRHSHLGISSNLRSEN